MPLVHRFRSRSGRKWTHNNKQFFWCRCVGDIRKPGRYRPVHVPRMTLAVYHPCSERRRNASQTGIPAAKTTLSGAVPANSDRTQQLLCNQTHHLDRQRPQPQPSDSEHHPSIGGSEHYPSNGRRTHSRSPALRRRGGGGGEPRLRWIGRPSGRAHGRDLSRRRVAVISEASSTISYLRYAYQAACHYHLE